MNWNYERDAFEFFQNFPDQYHMRNFFLSLLNFSKLLLFYCLSIIECWTVEQSGITSNERSCCYLLNLWLDCISNVWSFFWLSRCYYWLLLLGNMNKCLFVATYTFFVMNRQSPPWSQIFGDWISEHLSIAYTYK